MHGNIHTLKFQYTALETRKYDQLKTTETDQGNYLSQPGNVSSHLAEYLLLSFPGKIALRCDDLISNSRVVLSLSKKDLPEKNPGSFSSNGITKNTSLYLP
jgi:hypothetical protein